MDNFYFQNPCKIIFGKNTILKIGPEIKKYGYSKVLLIAGQGSIKKNRVYDQTIKSLKEAKIEWVEVWGVQPNPVLSKVREAIRLAWKEKPEAILAVGGGSVIDSAKAVSAGYYLDDIWQAFEGKVQIEKALPIFTILTLSATASEMNQWAVISNEQERKKWAIGAGCLIPQVSIIDPSVQTTLPWHQTVNGAIDGLSHLMENYFLGRDEETSMALCEALMRSIIISTDQLQRAPEDYNARSNLVWAITMAHNGVSAIGLKGGDWSAHRIEHGISAIHPEVAHGEGLAVVFPAWILYMHKSNPKTFQRWAETVWEARNVFSAVKKMRTKYRKWRAPIWLNDLKINQKEIKQIVKNVMQFKNLGVLKRLTKKDVEEILKLARAVE